MQILTVSELNRTARVVLEAEELLQDVYVRGELSNVKLHPSGHIYFSLRDEASAVRAVMFRRQAQTLRFTPENGMDVILRGRVSIFERDGAFQLYAEELEPAGVGAQFLALRELHDRLEAEGLFSPDKKRPLPLLPRRVGVVTSAVGAALSDIIAVARRRHPHISLVVAPVLVQGPRAAATLIGALEALGRRTDIDVIVIGRGGGSKEDLAAFNDEGVVRAVAASPIPIVSAVGHEIDTTLTDFAADKRAPTPSAAAELAIPVEEELALLVRMLQGRMTAALRRELAARRETVSALLGRRALVRPETLLDARLERVANLDRRLSRSGVERVRSARERLGRLGGALEGLSPLGALRRGFAVVERDGRIVRRAADLEVGTRIRARLGEGAFWASVEEIARDV